jgi:lysophospholipase L1-like esterase
VLVFARRTLATIATLVLALMPIPGPGPGPTTPPKPPPLPAITILSVGDSLTYGVDGSTTASYRQEFSRLLNAAGQPHAWVVQAVGGTKCSYWAALIDGLIVQYQPDLILLDCGTNDTPTDDTEADYRTILTAAQTHGVQLVAGLVGLPDMRSPTNIVRPDIDDWLHASNLAERAALADFPTVPYADTTRIPATLEWLQADGVHWTARAEAGAGQLLYQAARPLFGWPAIVEMCGLSGSWFEDPEPVPDVAYRVCRT